MTAILPVLVIAIPNVNDCSHSYDLCACCLLPAQFCDEIVHVRNFESQMQIAGRCAPWKVASGVAKNVVLQGIRAIKISV
jgi:hypothetical protein